MSELRKFIDKLDVKYKETNEKMEDFDIHFHNVYELYYFIEGDVDYLVEGKQYHLEPNSILLLAPYVLHGIRTNSTATYKRFAIHFSAELIELERRALLLQAFTNEEKKDMNEVYYTNVQDFSLYHYCEALIHCKEHEGTLVKKLLPVYLEALLAQLTLMYRSLKLEEESLTLSETVLDITAYINANLSERLTLDEISERFFISKNHLNRLFRKIIGTTVYDYIIYKRVGYAQYLLNKGVPVTEAALQVGFGDYSAFYRAYKKVTGHSPKRDLP